MSERITIVIEYDDRENMPRFGAGMDVLGGTAVAVQFNDALDENEKLKDACKSARSVLTDYEIWHWGGGAAVAKKIDAALG